MKPDRNDMKYIGIVLLILGVLGGLAALNMDTSVATEGRYGFPGRVVNLSLMEQRRTFLMLAGLATLIGAILTGISHMQLSLSNEPNDRQGNKTRSCPFCAEEIKQAAIVCKHCQRDVLPEDVDAHEEPETRGDEEAPWTDPLNDPNPPNLGQLLYKIEKLITRQVRDFCIDESGNPSLPALVIGAILVFLIGVFLYPG